LGPATSQVENTCGLCVLSDESNDVLVWLAAGAPEQQEGGGQ